MNKKVLTGSVLGAVLIFSFSFGLLMLFSQTLARLAVSTTNLLVSLIIFLLAPVGGGFIAGLVGQPNPRQAGTLAGAIASLLILAAFLFAFGFSFRPC